MASLGKKGGVFHVRFRFDNIAYKKSLKTRDPAAAKAALHLIELVLHRLLTGQVTVPQGVNVGDFVISGGRASAPSKPAIRPAESQTLRELSTQYLESQKSLLAPSYHYSQAIHLRHLLRFLNARADEPCRSIGYRDLDDFLQTRFAARHANTVERERITLLQFFRWIVRRGYLSQSPASGLLPVKGDVDRPPFRTITEIQQILDRGGRSTTEYLDLWECLYLNPAEIASLLTVIRKNVTSDCG